MIAKIMAYALVEYATISVPYAFRLTTRRPETQMTVKAVSLLI
jgi:hypothetical protein